MSPHPPGPSSFAADRSSLSPIPMLNEPESTTRADPGVRLLAPRRQEAPGDGRAPVRDLPGWVLALGTLGVSVHPGSALVT